MYGRITTTMNWNIELFLILLGVLLLIGGIILLIWINAMRLKKRGKIISAVLIFAIIASAVLGVYYSRIDMKPPPYCGPIAGLSVEKENQTYVITIEEISHEDELKYFSYCLMNNQMNETYVEGDVTDILNTQNNITSYDNDNNSKLSSNDLFVIKCEFVDTYPDPVRFSLKWKPTSSITMSVVLK